MGKDQFGQPLPPEHSQEFYELWYRQTGKPDEPWRIKDLANYGPHLTLSDWLTPKEMLADPELVDNFRDFDALTAMIANRNDNLYSPALRNQIAAFRQEHQSLLETIQKAPPQTTFSADQVGSLIHMSQDFYDRFFSTP